jgi:hypothetical protein
MQVTLYFSQVQGGKEVSLASRREHASLCRIGAIKKRDRLAGAVSFSLKGRSSVSRRIMKKKKVIGFVSYLSYCTYINLGL